MTDGGGELQKFAAYSFHLGGAAATKAGPTEDEVHPSE
jgi:hypothetical protein